MTFHTLDLATLHVLSDAIGRIDYDDAGQEQTREAARDAIAAAIASHTTALPPGALPVSCPCPALSLETISDRDIARAAFVAFPLHGYTPPQPSDDAFYDAFDGGVEEPAPRG